MMNKQGKVWGETTEIFNDQRVSIHYLSIKKGGYCSEHKHAWKTNLFFVIDGELMIRIWRRGSQVDETILRPGDSIIIPTHVWHQFVGLTNCKCLELYETGLWQTDIERRVQGGDNFEKHSQKEKIKSSKNSQSEKLET